MKILHVASFSGNIGDNASHQGLYSILNEIIDYPEIKKIEIRKFYKNYRRSDRRCFDREFVRFANHFDLLLIGGGGFFDYWVPNSKTGTTIDIDSNSLEDLRVPTLFASIGSFPHKEVPEGNVEKYRSFLLQLLEKDNVKIVLRNDGSLQKVQSILGSTSMSKIVERLDHGFFYRNDSRTSIPLSRPFIAINVATDQLAMKSEWHKGIPRNEFYESIARIVENIVGDLARDVLFVPHVFSDLEAVTKICSRVDGIFVRTNIAIAPCYQGNNGANQVYSLYNAADGVIATRFHANVCNIALGNRVLGIELLDRVKYLYESLGMGERSVPIYQLISDGGTEIVNELLRASTFDVTNSNTILSRMQTETIGTYRSFIQSLE